MIKTAFDNNNNAYPHSVIEESGAKIVLAIFRKFKSQVIFVGTLILCTAVLEGVTVGMFMPLVASVTGNFSENSSTIMQKIFFLVSSVPENSRLYIFGLGFIALLAIKGTVMVAQAHFSYRFIYSIRAHWVDSIFRKYLAGSLLFMRARSQGELVNDLVQETFRSVRAIQDALNLASRAITIFLLIIVMLVVDWRITLIATGIGVGSYLLGSKLIRNYSEMMGGRMLNFNRRITSDAMQALSGLREIKMYGAQDRTMEKFNQNVYESHRVQTTIQTLMQVPTAMAEVLLGVILVVLLGFITLVLGADPSDYLPQIGLFALAGIRIASNLSFIIQKRLHFGTFVASIRAINGMINTAAVPAEVGFGDTYPKGIESGIQFRNVSFTYAGELNILKNLDLTIKSKRITALVGPSGSGKSTIVDLLAGFYLPSSGDIVIDGEPLQNLNLEDWRSTIGYISQEPFLFSTSIRDNIALGMQAAKEEDLIQAAEFAHAADFISALPDGMNTVLGEGGYGLSLGQRQRVAVARAIARQPSLYIFDESTSGLDKETAASVENTIRKLSEDSTVILITHRETTAAIAHDIYHIVNGSAVRQEGRS